jgi:hypothetical protein
MEAVFRFKETCFKFTVYLSTFLHDTDYDILEAIEESNTVIEMLRAERQDESV